MPCDVDIMAMSDPVVNHWRCVMHDQNLKSIKASGRAGRFSTVLLLNHGEIKPGESSLRL
jgi:hypothetical protein